MCLPFHLEINKPYIAQPLGGREMQTKITEFSKTQNDNENTI